jgi:hypothetical protein
VRAGPSEGIAWGRRGRTGRAMRASSAPSPHTRTWSRNPVTLSRFRVPRKAGAARRSPAVPLPRLHRDGSAAARAVRREIASAPPTVTGRHVHYLERRTHHPVKRSPRPECYRQGLRRVRSTVSRKLDGVEPGVLRQRRYGTRSRDRTSIGTAHQPGRCQMTRGSRLGRLGNPVAR